MRGKSTYARRFDGPRMCTDPRSRARDPEPDVEYLPEGLSWSDTSRWIADHWLSRPGPWVLEGVATVRALRKWYTFRSEPPADRVLVFEKAVAPATADQEAMAKGILTIWQEIAARFADRTEIVDESIAMEEPAILASWQIPAVAV